jgi:hypothetical protein
MEGGLESPVGDDREFAEILAGLRIPTDGAVVLATG